ncbi:hypothetical protein [Niabella hibiscisoli]|uniref:hypothetical protein n=1 Tax=Niabella hibiscisoli TaxID=1825928 RepID=UPI001F0F2545|nr:hypothetical protein [Niabella hibiscisoli]MCH5720692.1 hypothetical protein [Niabella hibiscisoli]
MKKNFLLMVVLSLSIATTSFAQSSATPEVPKNYKPQPKELAPMPGELTDEMIFPVLGKYDYVNQEGEVASVTVSRDAENKGVVWINGMPQGKFKADLKQSPCTYKIPVQKTLQNDVDVVATEDTQSGAEKVAPRYSGKSLKEGTLIFDSASQKLYVNVGAKFDEENPAAIFPEMTAADESLATATPVEEVDATQENVKKQKKR